MCNMKMLCGQMMEKMILHLIRFFDVVMFINHSTNKSVNSKVFVVYVRTQTSYCFIKFEYVRMAVEAQTTTTTKIQCYVAFNSVCKFLSFNIK